MTQRQWYDMARYLDGHLRLSSPAAATVATGQRRPWESATSEVHRRELHELKIR